MSISSEQGYREAAVHARTALYFEEPEALAAQIADELHSQYTDFTEGKSSHFLAYFVIGHELHDKQKAFFLRSFKLDPELQLTPERQVLHRIGNTVLQAHVDCDDNGEPFGVWFEGANLGSFK
jgi:hypothetical protein